MEADDQATVAASPAATAMKDNSGAQAAPAGRWFTDQDCLLFIDDDNDTAPDPQVMPLHDAVLLDTYDDLLRCIDAWLNRTHDWRPIPANQSVLERPTPQVTLQTLSEPVRRVSLALPVGSDTSTAGVLDSLFESRRALPAEWQAFVAVRFHEQAISVLLDTVVLGDGDRQRLASGALVVLPASFGAEWRVAVEAVGRPGMASLKGILHVQTGQLEIPPDGQALANWLDTAATGDEHQDLHSQEGSAHPIDTAPEAVQQGESEQLLRVECSQSIRINLQACESAWRAGQSMRLECLPDATRLGVKLCPSGDPGDDAAQGNLRFGELLPDDLVHDALAEGDECSDPDSGKQVLQGSVVQLGQGYGVMVHGDSDVSRTR